MAGLRGARARAVAGRITLSERDGGAGARSSGSPWGISALVQREGDTEGDMLERSFQMHVAQRKGGLEGGRRGHPWGSSYFWLLSGSRPRGDLF